MSDKCYLTNPNNQPKEPSMYKYMLLAKVSAKDFFLTEREFQDVLKEHGLVLFHGFLTAPNEAALKWIAIEACIPGDIIEFNKVIPVNHEGYGEIYP
jgi:hypothetical protein